MWKKYRTLPSRVNDKAIKELEHARSRLYNLFHFPKSNNILEPRAIPSETPHQFSFARFLCVVSWLLYTSLREQNRNHEAVHHYVESFSLLKGNLLLNFQNDFLMAPETALYIWEYHRQSPFPFLSGPIASTWLKEAKDIAYLVGGKKYVEKVVSEYVNDLESNLLARDAQGSGAS
jgi:hypothetical protein